MSFPEKVKIVEVGARDGLQNEPQVSTQAKIDLINGLSQSGLKHIEAGSFVSPKWVPQMADSHQVLRSITRFPGVAYSALTPNLQGFLHAIDANVDYIAIFASASETFSQKNINCTIEQSLERFEPVVSAAQKKGIPVRGYLSCVIDCPYEGKIAPQQVRNIAKLLSSLGCYEISLGDTVGTGTPVRIQQMLEAVNHDIALEQIAVHFHNTWGQALANLFHALSMGVSVIDSSVAGLGGCPYAPGASGNVATEDVVYLCHELGIETGVDLTSLTQVGWSITQHLNRTPSSNVALAIGKQ
ncbi:hydroxymethylglutaryl-CoA lyase [Vibrio sinaloensis DSM 21326]|uniref:hydroxymethylglutaryl-CoA lyase n=1 Tax=Vibrio sinaloensis DSM 21326 TaxID=945550 RepID=E8M592_PHOS4|nr:hydroxymethylglutaryl-CoA lyase [Vibrio sinaloensis]EGA70685.1 hydroxymethylglutaryl-CoA lyase [Vibrio sinaloensis DSM 21326]